MGADGTITTQPRPTCCQRPELSPPLPFGVARAADRAARVQHHHGELGAVSSAPSRASVLLMDEVTVARLSEPFVFVPKVSQKCSGRIHFP